MSPTCRECGGLCVTRDGRATCSACGYVAGTALAVADTLPNVVLARNLSGGKPDKILLGLALAEARDEGHAAGRKEALEEALNRVRCCSDGTFHFCNCSCESIRALAGKL